MSKGGRRNGKNAPMCLRKTRTSEDAPFIANCNEARCRFMRREVDCWYKDTRQTLRCMSEDQQKLYYSLLELSKKKKAIKIGRDEMRRKKFRGVYSPIMEERELDKEVHCEANPIEPRKASANTHPHEEIKYSKVEILTAASPTFEKAEEGALNHSDANDKSGNEPSIEKGTGALNKLGTLDQSHTEQLNGTRFMTTFDNNTTPIQAKVQTQAESQICDRMNRTDKVTDDNSGLLTTPQFACPVNLKCEFQEIVESFPSTLHGDFYTGGDPKISPISNSSQNPAFSTLPFMKSRQVVPCDSSTQSESSSMKGPACRRKRKGRQDKKRSIKKRSDPSEELNTKSSIQAMHGKVYRVSTYRRDSNGSLLEECKTIDTTVDVSQYFNFKYYRDQHIRRKLLEESRLIGGEQRRRVDEFLLKLIQKEEEVRARAEKKAKEMEEAIAIQSQKHLMNRKPPRYGMVRENSIAPSYIRKYKRRSNIDAEDTSRERRRSSWYIPSLHTLHLKAPVSHRALFYTNETNPGKNKELVKLRCSAHLVDMKLESYIKAAA